jgi:uncharacterized membrane protein YphA (DoxX/SURF4 family)
MGTPASFPLPDTGARQAHPTPTKDATVNITLWIIAALLALVFLAAGAMKLTQPKDKLAASGQGWVENVSTGAIKAIGTAEILGALGLILPALLNIAPALVAAAATGLFLLMIGAAITHARRKETPNIIVNTLLGILAVTVAITRFGPYPF